MVGINIRVDTRRAVKKLHKYSQFVEKQAGIVAKEVAEAGRWYAKTIAPQYNSNLVRLIKIQRGGKQSWTVVSENPTRGNANRIFGTGRFPNFNLVRWMHETGGVFQSNNPFGKAGTQKLEDYHSYIGRVHCHQLNCFFGDLKSCFVY